MPEGGDQHVLDRALLAIAQLDAGLGGARLGPLWIIGCLLGRLGFANRHHSLELNRLRLQRLPIPLRIAEVVVGLYEVVDREVILAVVQAGATADDLLELDHRIHRPQQHDVAHVAVIDPRGELLGGGEDGGDGLLVVLEGPEPGVAQFAVVGGDPLAVVGIAAALELVDQVAYARAWFWVAQNTIAFWR